MGGITVRSPRTVSRRAFAARGLGALGSCGGVAALLAQGRSGASPSVAPETEQANVAVVNDFCAAFKRKDLDRIGALLAENCVYRVTQTRPAMTGRAAVVEFFRPAMDRGEIDFRVLRTVVMGPIVVNERDDVLPGAAGQAPRIIRIHAGLFFVQDGKILEWTDYVLR